MYMSSLKPVTCWVPLVTGGNGSNPNASKVTSVNRQAVPAVKVQMNYMKEREQPLLQEVSAVSSRREMMLLAAVSICLPSLFFPATSEARPGEANMTQKITGKVEELKEKAGSSVPKLQDLKEKAGSSGAKLQDLKEKAGSSVPKLEDLKEKAGSSLPNVENLKEKAGLSKPNVEELKEKAGMSMPKGEGNKPKPISEMYGSKASASQQTLVLAPQEEPSVPTLQTLPPRSFLIG